MNCFNQSIHSNKDLIIIITVIFFYYKISITKSINRSFKYYMNTNKNKLSRNSL